MGASRIFGVSLRGLLAMMAMATICTMQYQGKEVKEPLYSVVLLIVGAYFGQAINRTQKPDAKKEQGNV